MVAPLVAQIAPGAAVLPIDQEGYAPKEPIRRRWTRWPPAARKYRPDLFLVAPFQWTVVEERLATELAGVAASRWTGRAYSDPNFGPRAPRA